MGARSRTLVRAVTVVIAADHLAGYLALSTVQLAGTFHARRPPLSDPLLVKSITVRLRCYEYRTAGVFAHAAENILFEAEQILFRPRDGNAYQQLETDTFESVFKLEVPVRSDAKRLPSSATFKEWKVVWKLEARACCSDGDVNDLTQQQSSTINRFRTSAVGSSSLSLSTSATTSRRRTRPRPRRWRWCSTKRSCTFRCPVDPSVPAIHLILPCAQRPLAPMASW